MHTPATASPDSSSAANTSALRTENVTLSWDKHVVSTDLSVDIPAGKFTAIIGPNGCGKSTLLKSCARILAPDTGSLYLHGHDLTHLHTKEIAKQLALLPQSTITPADITVEELVRRGRFPHHNWLHQWTKEDTRAVDAALSAASVKELTHKRVTDLSGGQRQRVWLAMVLAQNTPTVLLDEPTTFLDIAHQYQLLELARSLTTQLNRTVVAVLHDLQQAVRYADHLIVMKNGSVVATGSPKDVISAELISEVFNITVRTTLIDDQLIVIPTELPVPNVAMMQD
ncbi:ABC transporter ATP-binding protein [Corynebacterium silvaticum]|uniref:ABC transporter ATP-binding protein n=1 Tax=Corynebacterium silvaticum TaxID=2320431 RepID=A0A7Y4P9T5_9CORY|nr:ABC transporter ATP-binding protein [Corynebacterium silvaticum]ARU45193.1 ABC transporter ATP-binding protein [Corynebacterium silvaticum]MBH5301025.1 ABC transporter ATP-binding protein [Corynebacterium silvaticum]NOM65226.1 ABC transporter ATP-binding protein [Corynebacterium silvaticum]NON70860.1 ABC transporter ATP-binding protein [Corynebacterium silvaticum]TFA92762.1 ABC transporter ATP-binding protein [Corynebacterium silvaticum]